MIWPSSFRRGPEQRMPSQATESGALEKENASRRPPALALLSCN